MVGWGHYSDTENKSCNIQKPTRQTIFQILTQDQAVTIIIQ